MTTKIKEWNGELIHTMLSLPFNETEVKWRISQSGIAGSGRPYATVVPYLDARSVMQRFDNILGADRWHNTVVEIKEGFLATITVLCGNDDNLIPISKQDVAELSNIEATKGGASDAFKRAAVLWGVGRYLYNTGKHFAEFIDSPNNSKPPGAYSSCKINGASGTKKYWWKPPTLNVSTMESIKDITKPIAKKAKGDF